MTTQQLAQLCQDSLKAIRPTADFIRAELGKVGAAQVEVKDLNSLVSYVDKTAEEQLVKSLGALLPEATFLTEEGTVEQAEGKYRWIIDPLDGTTNFLHQIPFFSISVALLQEEEVVMGLVVEVVREEYFSAWKGGGAWLNGQPIKVSGNEQLADALVATGFPYYDFDRLDGYMALLRKLFQATRGLRRLGSAALDLAYVSCGRFDAFFEYGLNPWDVAAGVLLVEEAGGKVTDFSNGKNYIFGRELVCGSPAVHVALHDLTKQHLQSASL
ncbi:MAG: inositol monophosphatase family protein [Bacteroidota bacterium]